MLLRKALVPVLMSGAIVGAGCGEEKKQNVTHRKKPVSHIKSGENDPVPAQLVDCAEVPPDHLITISNRRLSENPLRVQSGDVVQWNNLDDLPHTVTSGVAEAPQPGSLFDSGVLAKGESTCVRFNKTGYFSYFCTSHADGNGGGVDVVADE